MPTFHTADGAELTYVDLGPRGSIPLLFVHGWLGATASWTLVMEPLARRHRTIGIDLRGFGESNAAPGPYRVETYADDLSALVASLDLDPLVVIGHSMGAAVAQRFAIDRPDAVEGLVLVAPVPASGMPFPPHLVEMFRSIPGDPARAAAWLGTLTHDEPSREIRTIMRAAAAAADTDAALENFESWRTLDFADEAATIATPTLVLAASGDRPEFARAKVADVIDGSRFQIVDAAGHYVPLERPDRVAQAIEDFVESL
jgi:pimeloyl-ACP methyl ester carboxylesterase